MVDTIDNAFVRQYEAEVHLTYQRQGSRLRPTVRNKAGVRGASTTFQRVGKGSASRKGRHGKVPVMTMKYLDPVECVLQDWYAGEWIDKLDELKTNVEERQVISNSAAYALGRKSDDLVIAALRASTEITTFQIERADFTAATVLKAFEELGAAEVPDDGERYAVVGWKQWSQLLAMDEFSKADYVGETDLPWRDFQARYWLGTMWLPHSALNITAKGRECYWYHKTAIGHATGTEIKTDISWHGDRAAHFVNSMMSQGACLIDPSGVVQMNIKE
ncbi:MAG: phage capsid protein [Alphaproteobacteria bacterium]